MFTLPPKSAIRVCSSSVCSRAHLVPGLALLMVNQYDVVLLFLLQQILQLTRYHPRLKLLSLNPISQIEGMQGQQEQGNEDGRLEGGQGNRRMPLRQKVQRRSLLILVLALFPRLNPVRQQKSYVGGILLYGEPLGAFYWRREGANLPVQALSQTLNHRVGLDRILTG